MELLSFFRKLTQYSFYANSKVEQDGNLNENTIRPALSDLASVWDELFAPEKRRLTELLIKRIELAAEQVTVYLKPDGMNAVAIELQP